MKKFIFLTLVAFGINAHADKPKNGCSTDLKSRSKKSRNSESTSNSAPRRRQLSADERQMVAEAERLLDFNNAFEDTLRYKETSFYDPFFQRELYKEYPHLAAAIIIKEDMHGWQDVSKRHLAMALEHLKTVKPGSIRIPSSQKSSANYYVVRASRRPGNLGPDILYVIRPLWNGLLRDLHSDMVNTLSEAFAEMAMSEPLVDQLSAYARFKMVKEYIRKTLGLPHIEVMRDLAVRVKQNKFTVLGYSNQPIAGVPMNKFGFAITKVAEFNADRSGQQRVQWNVGDRTLSATIKYTKVKPDAYIPKAAAAPDYAELLRDGLGGMVVISNNMDGFGHTLARNYIEYFSNQGFRFSQRRMTSEEAKKFILDEVKSGKIDFFVREGHSEFSEDHFVQLSQNLILHTGIKDRPGVRDDEIVHIIGPASPRVSPGASMAFSELGEALRSRPNPTQDFLFFETACYSADGTDEMIQATGAPGFIPVGSDTMEDTFTGDGNTGVDILLNGIRNRRSYAEIKEEMEKLGEEGDTESGFVLPNERGYQRGSRANLSPFLISIERDFAVTEDLPD